MSITVSHRDGDLTVALSGEIDHHGAHTVTCQLEELISSRLPHRLTLDLSAVSFMDSSGIALLLRTRRSLAQIGAHLRVTGTPPQPKKVLDLAGLGRLITFD